MASGWLVVGLLTFLGYRGRPLAALGLVLFGVAAVLLGPAIVGADGKPLASLVMTSTALRFFLDFGV